MLSDVFILIDQCIVNWCYILHIFSQYHATRLL